MKILRFVFSIGFIFAAARLCAQTAPAEDPNTIAAAAAVAERPHTPPFIEHAVDVILQEFDVTSTENTPIRYVACAAILLITIVVCRVIISIIFAFIRRLTSKTKTEVDDKLFKAVQTPVTAFTLVVGCVGAIRALKLTPAADNVLGYVYTIAFSLVMFWFLLRIFNTVLDHLHEQALEKKMGVAAFMPWIKKTLLAIFFVFGVLMIAESLGADVKAFLGALGIGGLAFALAAQDTIANLFGSVVVAVDQPFKIGETIQVGSTIGMVEDIGLRSTKIRRVDKALVVIPNKTVAAESIINLARFTERRVEQVLGVTYDTTAEQMAELVEEIRRLIVAEPEVDAESVNVYFRDFSGSSLDIWLVYVAKDADFKKHMALRQRLNLAFMRAVLARGLSFAFPTQTLHFDGDIARRMAAPKGLPPANG